MKSLDPRVNRLPKIDTAKTVAKDPLDQFGTFEVFVQPKEGKPFQHEGAVHAPDIELAFVLAKEAFTRRFQCTSLFVAETRNVFVSAMTEGNDSVYDHFSETSDSGSGQSETYEIFHLIRRGKQHVHAGQVQARNPGEAMKKASTSLRPAQIVYNVWVVRTADIRFTHEDEKDLWNTLPEKKFRDASAYKAGDKLTSFLQKS